MPSPNIQYTTHNLKNWNRVANDLRRLAADVPAWADPVMYRWAQRMRATLKSTKYPPMMPMQKYVRTGRFANSWGVDKVRSGWYVVRNSATHRGVPYARYVTGDGMGRGQAWMHVGRWWKSKNVMEKHTPELVRDLTKVYTDIDR